MQIQSGTDPEEESAGGLVWHEGDMPYSTRFGDHYYSRDDGRAECRHVFLKGNGLPERWQGRGRFTIGELGFGTGLNLLETWRTWRICRDNGTAGGHLSFVSFERYPLRADEMTRALAVWDDLAPLCRELLAHWPEIPSLSGDIRLRLDDTVDLTVMVGDAIDRIGDLGEPVDAWYLDGFSPARNPELWSEALMRALAAQTAEDGTFATYSAAGWVRRNLQAAGFAVEKVPGYGGKRDMTRGGLAA